MAISASATEGKLTPELIAEFAAQIGVECEVRDRPWNQYATRDTIYHFARGYGDDNPLWVDEDYAAKTRWGDIVAPPTFLMSCGVHIQRGLRGIHALWTADDWEYFRPIKNGDKITMTFKLLELTEKRSRFANKMMKQLEEFTYRNQHGQTIGICRRTFMRMERGAARESGKYEGITRYEYSLPELEAIDAAYRDEQRRGATPRYWEDVEVGEKVPAVLKGPLTISSEVAWCSGIGGGQFTYVHKMAFDFWRKHPGARALHPGTNVPEYTIAVHWDNNVALAAGIKVPYDIGGERIAALGHMLTNWMGDDGFIRSHYVEMRRPNYMGDTTWYKAAVTRKYVENGQHLVDIDYLAENQRGEVHTTGHGTVLLPSRESARWPADVVASD